jgi:hypothetical protein
MKHLMVKRHAVTLDTSDPDGPVARATQSGLEPITVWWRKSQVAVLDRNGRIQQ